jgi:hypothetical protein
VEKTVGARRAVHHFVLVGVLCAVSLACQAESPDLVEGALREHEDFVNTLKQLRPKIEIGLSTFVKQPELLKMQCRMWQGQMNHSIAQARQDEATLERKRDTMSAAQAERFNAAKSQLGGISSEFRSCSEL